MATTKKLQIIGGFPHPLVRMDIDCNNEPKSLLIEDNTIYNVVNCTTLTILLPSTGSYLAHLFVNFANSGEARFILPSGIPVYGTNASTTANGDVWELNIDSAGGIICWRK